MMSVKMLPDTFDDKMFCTPDIEQSEYQTPCIIEIKLCFEPSAAYRVYDDFDDQCITRNDDGSFIVNMSMPDDYWICDYLLSFGAAVEVLEPQELCDEIVRQAEKIKNKYSSKT
jgi:predicted DNA-binding transcriptional regulator YafY